MAINIPPDNTGAKQPGKTSEAAAGKAQAALAGKDVQAAQSDALKTASATIKAVVAEVQAKQASGHYSKALYEALVQLNPNTQQRLTPQVTQGQRIVDQLDAALIRQVLNGKPATVRVETQAPLKTGQQLEVQIQNQALKLLKVSPAPLQASVQQFIRQEMNQQNSYVHLLAKLMGIARSITKTLSAAQPQTTSNSNPAPAQPGAPATTRATDTIPTGKTQPSNTRTANASTAPAIATTKSPSPGAAQADQIAKRLEQIVKQFIKVLPTQEQASTPQGLKEAIRNSGIFYEKQLINPDLTNSPKPQSATSTANPNASKANQSKAAPAANKQANVKPQAAGVNNEIIQQIKQHIKAIRNVLNETAQTPKATSQTSSQPTSQAPTPITDYVAKDLKANLLKLENQLQQLQQDAKPTPTSPAKATTPTANPPGSASISATGTEKTDTVKSAKVAPDQQTNALKDSPLMDKPGKTINKGMLPDAGKTGTDKPTVLTETITTRPNTGTGSPIYSKPISQPGALYSEDSNTTPAKSNTPGTDWTQPPLPGKINIQPQLIRPNLSANESLADALISVLIKHTREATSRMNLHQLTSMADMSRGDGGPQQTALSFELPILQGTYLALFQFRIWEEDEHSGKEKSENDKDKKWVVHMGFDLEGLGPMYCQISLIGVSASVTFWAEHKQTVEHSKQHIKSLRENLSNLGVTVKDIHCLEGSPPTDQSGIKQTLIDIET